MNSKLRLQRLYDFHHLMANYEEYFKIEKIPFNMHVWYAGEVKHACGTAACALGAACLLPQFRKQGLKLKADWVGDRRPMPTYAGERGEEAGEKFFGITKIEADCLFYPYNYRINGCYVEVTPAMVANKIQKLINKYERAAA